MNDNLFEKGDRVRIKNVVGMNIESDLVSEIINATGVITSANHAKTADEPNYSVETTDLSGIPVEIFAFAHNLERVQNPPYKIARSVLSLIENMIKTLRNSFKRCNVYPKTEVYTANYYVRFVLV